MKLLVFLKEKREKNGENCVSSSVNSSNFANILEKFAKFFLSQKIGKKDSESNASLPILKNQGYLCNIYPNISCDEKTNGSGTHHIWKIKKKKKKSSVAHGRWEEEEVIII